MKETSQSEFQSRVQYCRSLRVELVDGVFILAGCADSQENRSAGSESVASKSIIANSM